METLLWKAMAAVIVIGGVEVGEGFGVGDGEIRIYNAANPWETTAGNALNIDIRQPRPYDSKIIKLRSKFK